MARPLADLELHLCVWDDNVPRLVHLLSASPRPDTEVRDARRNTPLLLAYRLGRLKCARALLAHGAYPKARSESETAGWEAIQTAALSRSPDVLHAAVCAFLAETDDAFGRRLPSLQAALAAMPDFSLTMSWAFSSWVPLLGGLLPSDTYSVFKRGSALRLDTTLLGFAGLKWERGSVSLLLHGAESATPGALTVMDNELKTCADARAAFHAPTDTQLQDWVRKLLVQKAKQTDFWSRDARLEPELREGLVGGLLSSSMRLLRLGGGPRGRVSDPRERAGAAATPVAALLMPVDDDGGDGGGGGGGGGGDDDAPPPPPDERVVREDVGVWPACAAYRLRNLCMRDFVVPPLLKSLPLDSWWRPDVHSRHAGKAPREARVEAAVAAGEAAAARVYGGAAHAPERLLRPLQGVVKAVKSGAVTEVNAVRLTRLEDAVALGGGSSEGADGDDDDDDDEGGGDPDLQTTTPSARDPVVVTDVDFTAYFLAQRPPAPPAGGAAPGRGAAPHGASSRGAGPHGGGPHGGGAHGGGAPPPAFVAPDGRLHRPTAALAELRPEAVAVEDRVLDGRVLFSKDFPLTPEQFLPVAEVMSRTGAHAANLRRFFSTKFPPGAGFPVQFSLPVFFGINATVTFEHMETRRPVPRALFEVPADYVHGAFVERGFLRQL